MRVLIIDDEPLAQKALANVLTKRHDVEQFETARDAVEALDKLTKESYDLLLLDISMPEISGMELLDRFGGLGQPMPAVVFVTAHEKYAIEAFRQHAIDYVLKPFSGERINEALDVAFRRTAAERAAVLLRALPYLREPISQRKPKKIAVKTKGRILFIDPNDLIAVHAEGNYVLLHREADSWLLREPISDIAEKLKPYGFLRIHRSVLINIAYVEEIKPLTTGEYNIRLRCGKSYTMTRSYKKNLKELAASWIGTDGPQAA